MPLIVPGGNRFLGRQSSSPGGSYTSRKTMTRLGG